MKHKKILKLTSLLGSIFVVLCFALLPFFIQAANAEPCQNVPGKKLVDCLDAAANESGMTPEQFQQKIDECLGVTALNGVGGPLGAYNLVEAGLTPSTAGCANAIVSCHKNSSPSTVKDCDDGALLSWISSCNNGDVGAQPTRGGPTIDVPGVNAAAGCGVDGAKWTMNEYFGKKFTTNDDIVENGLDSLQKSECTKENNYGGVDGANDTEKLNKCKALVKQQYVDCASSTSNSYGAEHYNKVDETAIQNCMAGKATTQEQCTAVAPGYQFVNGKCVAPPPPPDACDTKYPIPSAANPGHPTVEEAKAIGRAGELNGACKEGQQGKDCATAGYKTDSLGLATGDELKAACEAGANAKNNVADGPSQTITKSNTHCGEARVNLIACGTEQGGVALNNVLKIIISVLTVLVGIASVGGIAWASVLYAKAGDSEGNVSEAKVLIRNVVIGVLLYAFLIAIVGWLVPGSVIT